MMQVLEFIGLIAHELHDLFVYSTSNGSPDPEYEQMLAMRIVRKLADERARREIPGP